jgi:hypothetical protein
VQPLLQIEETGLLLQRRETADHQDYYRDDEHGTINEEEEEGTNATGKLQSQLHSLSFICVKWALVATGYGRRTHVRIKLQPENCC